MFLSLPHHWYCCWGGSSSGSKGSRLSTVIYKATSYIWTEPYNTLPHPMLGIYISDHYIWNLLQNFSNASLSLCCIDTKSSSNQSLLLSGRYVDFPGNLLVHSDRLDLFAAIRCNPEQCLNSQNVTYLQLQWCTVRRRRRRWINQSISGFPWTHRWEWTDTAQ